MYLIAWDGNIRSSAEHLWHIIHLLIYNWRMYFSFNVLMFSSIVLLVLKLQKKNAVEYVLLNWLFCFLWILCYFHSILSGFQNMFLPVFPFSSHVSESVNNSIFHQIAEQLQQQNLEHLRQQLLEQQQPQKVYNPILWSLELLLFIFYKLAFLLVDFFFFNWS